MPFLPITVAYSQPDIVVLFGFVWVVWQLAIAVCSLPFLFFLLIFVATITYTTWLADLSEREKLLLGFSIAFMSHVISHDVGRHTAVQLRLYLHLGWLASLGALHSILDL